MMKKSKSQIQYVKSLLIDPFTEEDLTRIYTKITGNTELEHFESWAKKETKGGELSGPEKKKLSDRWQEKRKEQKNTVAQFYTECGNTKEHIIPQCLISKSTAQPGMILGNKAKRVSKDLNGVLRARGMIFFADNESHKRHVGTKWLIEAKEKVQIEKLTALKEKKNEEIIHDERANLSFFKED